MIETLVWVLLVIGAVFTALAGIGIVRLPDVFIRMHAATKVGTLGSGLIMAGVAVHLGETDIVIRCVLIAVFLMLTAPIGAHMIGRAALRMGVKAWGMDEDGKPLAREGPGDRLASETTAGPVAQQDRAQDS